MVEETSYRWPLDDFESRFGKAAFKQLWESGDFKVAGVPQATFRVRFNPKGDGEKNKDSCALYLHVAELGGHPFIRLNFAIWIENAENKLLKKGEAGTQRFHVPQKSWGWQAFVAQQELVEFARTGPIAVCCSIRPEDPIDAVEWAEKTAPSGLFRKIAAAFDSDHFADTEVHVQGKVFKVTRMIICSGSPVFRRMFTHDTKEKETGVVEIKKENADLIELLLRFLYSGGVKNLADNAARLLPVADCYEVLELAELCLHSLVKRVSVQSVLRDLQLTFAHDHSGDFKQKVLEFAHKNFKQVRQQPDWTTAFIRDNSEIAEALFEVLTPE